MEQSDASQVDLLVAEQRGEQPGHGEPVLQDVMSYLSGAVLLLAVIWIVPAWRIARRELKEAEERDNKRVRDEMMAERKRRMERRIDE